MKLKLIPVILIVWAGFASIAFAIANTAVSTTGVQGYDLVSYHSSNGPVQGSGHHVSEHNGVTYLFASKKNKQAFDQNPQQYLPAYGGYCAYGVSVGKKFIGDPNVWKIVEGTLYLNLDRDIQKEWSKDIPGRIQTANEKWKEIKDKSPNEL